MLPIPRRHAHYVFGALQSGLTTAIASAIATASHLDGGPFLSGWLWSWLLSWAVMLPVVLVAAPLIRRAAVALTRE